MWIDLLDNRRALTSVFGESEPSLDSFTIKEISLNTLNNSLKVIGDLSSYPVEPPIKWKKGKFNTVHVVLEFWNLSSLNLGDFKGLKTIDLIVSQEGSSITCKASSGFYCKAELLDLLEISAYQNS